MNYPPTFLQEAPGAKAARTCGILAIICALSCVCFPVGIILGIVAILKHGKAKRLATEQPEAYRMPTQTGMVTGIIGLVMAVVFALPGLGMVSAIAIPALLSQRARARDKAVISNLHAKLPELVERYEKGLETGGNAMSIKGELDAYLQSTSAEKNPYNIQAPAFRYTIAMTMAGGEGEMVEAARAQATTVGEVVFIMSAPVDPQAPRFLAGAVRTQTPVNGSPIYVKVVAVN
jgi:hypothetical protein